MQYWTAANGFQIAVDPDGTGSHGVDTSRFDPAAPLFGVDEDGDVVPAFMADPSVGRDPDEPLENGSSVGLLLGFIATRSQAREEHRRGDGRHDGADPAVARLATRSTWTGTCASSTT